MVDPRAHERFLAYREKHIYFGRGPLGGPPLSLDEFIRLEAELRQLSAKERALRTNDEAQRIAALRAVLHVD